MVVLLTGLQDVSQSARFGCEALLYVAASLFTFLSLNPLNLAIEIHGLKERHFDLSADTFVTVSVDGEQQLQTPVVENDLNPTWSFNPPFGLYVDTEPHSGPRF